MPKRLKYWWACLKTEVQSWLQFTIERTALLWHSPGPYLLASSFLLVVAWATTPLSQNDPHAAFWIDSVVKADPVVLSAAAIMTGIFGFFASPFLQRQRFVVAGFGVLLWWLFPTWSYFLEGYYSLSALSLGMATITTWSIYRWFRERTLRRHAGLNERTRMYSESNPLRITLREMRMRKEFEQEHSRRKRPGRKRSGRERSGREGPRKTSAKETDEETFLEASKGSVDENSHIGELYNSKS